MLDKQRRPMQTFHPTLSLSLYFSLPAFLSLSRNHRELLQRKLIGTLISRRFWVFMCLFEEMAKQNLSFYFYFPVLVLFATLPLKVWADTDPLDVRALQDLYKALNNPSQLKRWKQDGGDPCEESWTGVLCSGSSVIHIKLLGLNLHGHLGSQLDNLHNLKQLDISYNNIQGDIPYRLPPNATHLNLACNNLSQNSPYNLSFMENLGHLNMSHNSLSGPIGNVFTGLHNLRELDLSYNNLSGDLPSSFESLTKLRRLFLQKNKFTGSVIFLNDLPLTDLNIQDNHFSGIIPNHFQFIPNLWIGGNTFHVQANDVPWDFPLETVSIEKNTTVPPKTESSAIENYPSTKIKEHKRRRLGPGGIGFMVGLGTLVISGALFIAIRINQSRTQKLHSLQSNYGSLHGLPISNTRVYSSSPAEGLSQVLAVRSSPISTPRRVPPVLNISNEIISRRKSFTKNFQIPENVKHYTVAELQLATNSFSEENLIGEGSLGSVYKAEFPDGKIMAIKNINMVPLSFSEEEQFLEVIWILSRLIHPNIVKFIGYCIEHGQHLLVYEYVKNVSLNDALHSEAPLLWCIRLRIALGVAHALDYMHSTFSPPLAHSNIKSANILLDEELMPHICDCGLAIFKPLTSNRVKLKAFEIAIQDTGYIAPEHGQPEIDNTKTDIYAFGVLLLELLTGRVPFDSTRSVDEKSLVTWASSRLHDSESLEQMVDPRIKRTISSQALSRYADIVSVCIQPEKEFRPPMSEVVESLRCLLKKPSTMKSSTADCDDIEPLEKSFHSTRTVLLDSPAWSYSSP